MDFIPFSQSHTAGMRNRRADEAAARKDEYGRDDDHRHVHGFDCDDDCHVGEFV